jgi:hypothetical protein
VEMALMYIITYLWVNHWLVFITYLQHTDPLLRESIFFLKRNKEADKVS